MSSKIIGVTVGTPLSPEKIAIEIEAKIKAYIDQAIAEALHTAELGDAKLGAMKLGTN